MSTCDKKGCTKTATHGIYLVLRVHPYHEPAISDVFLRVCEEHSRVQWADVVTNEGWQQIRDGFVRAGRQAPKQEFSGVAVRELAKNE